MNKYIEPEIVFFVRTDDKSVDAQISVIFLTY
jgi:hypothetical protein